MENYMTEQNLKLCSYCKKQKPLSCFDKHTETKDGLNSLCVDCHHLVCKKWRDNNKEKRKQAWKKYSETHKEQIKLKNLRYKKRQKDLDLQSTFGITLDQYNQMLKDQNGVCVICKNPENEVEKGKQQRTLSVDHNHKTGKVRGLLCGKCNKGIGLFKDNIYLLQSAIDYLKKEK
jgi:hypothetical protein